MGSEDLVHQKSGSLSPTTKEVNSTLNNCASNESKHQLNYAKFMLPDSTEPVMASTVPTTPATLTKRKSIELFKRVTTPSS